MRNLSKPYIIGLVLAMLVGMIIAACFGPSPTPVATSPTAAPAAQGDMRDIRIVVVSHGQASDPFWSVVKNGVDLKFYQPKMQGKDIADKLGLQNKFIVSYIGTLGMAHALDYVLRTAKRFTEVRDIVFLIVGSGAERETLMQLKAKENLDNVILIERQPKELIPKFYAISDVCLVTLKNKPLFRTVVPSKIFEIMAMAKPVILGVDGESREIVEEAQAGIFVEPENEKDLEKTILRLYKNRKEGQILGNNGRIFVEKYFNRDTLADEYIEILCQPP